jgi:hypothetical protein
VVDGNQQLVEALSHGFIDVVYTYGLNAAGEPYQEYKKLVDDAEAFLAAKPAPKPVSEDARDAQRFRQLEAIFSGLTVGRSQNILNGFGFRDANPCAKLSDALPSAGKGAV